MAIERFWSSVRGAAAGVFRFNVIFFADQPFPTREEIAECLQADTNWFRKPVLHWFRREDFSEFLQAEELSELVNGVEGVKAALTSNNLTVGIKEFTRILTVLNFYRYADLDGLRFGKQIEHKLQEEGWPKELSELRFWRATRDEEFPVLSIYAYLKTVEVKNVAGFLDASKRLRPLLDEISKEVAPGWFAHITFRTDELLPEYADRPDEDEQPAPSNSASEAV